MDVTSIEEAKHVLYAEPLDSFVAARNALVKEIRAGGDRALATEVKSLRKPSAVAAQVNEIVRADPDGVDLILQAAGLLRAAQAGALEGSEIDAGELQQHYRAAVQALAQTATSRRVEVRAALEAATIDEESNDDLRHGCLVAVPTPVSIFGLGDPSTQPNPTTAKTAPAKAAPAKKPAVAKAAAKPQVDELEERRALRRKAKSDQDAAAEKALAAEAERRRKEQAKERQKQKKALTKAHREALRLHLAALEAEDAASLAIERSVIECNDLAAEITRLEQELAAARERSSQVAEERHTGEQAKAEAHQRSIEAKAQVDDLAATLDDLNHAQT